jgi:hypothetical protein
MVDLSESEMDWPGHIHNFVIMHEFPEEYKRDNNSFVRCNDCGRAIWFLAEQGEWGAEDGFLHCIRSKTKEWQVPSLLTDLQVEELLAKRLYLNMPWDRNLFYFRDLLEITCSFDLCWTCYFKDKKNPHYIVQSCEI